MAEFTFDCPACGVSIETDDSLRGSTVQCPECSNYIAIPEMSLSDGMELGDYKLERRLGIGGMGEVWLAMQRKLARRVALKVLSPNFTKDQEFVARFVQEVKMAGRLNHPNIVTAYDAGFDKGMHYLAIEFVDGVELSNRLKIDKGIDEKESLRIVRKVADALHYAWTKFKILHRDIKPANIMIGSDGEPKLMDMGISKSMEEDSGLTMTGVVVGTPYYMSPEQAKASKDIDCRADIYSLGATLYHLVTGTVPYDGPTALAIISRHMSESLPPPQERNPKLSSPCAALIETMMAKAKEDRQHGWDEVIADIDLVLAGKFPASGRPANGKSLVMRQSSSRTDKDRGVGASQVSIKAPDPLPDLGAARPAGSRRKAILAVALVVTALLSAGTLLFLSHDANRRAKEAELKTALEAQMKENARKDKEAEARQSKANASAEENEAKRRMEALWESASSMAETALKKGSGFDLAIEALNKFTNSGASDEIYLNRAKKLRRDLKTARERAAKGSLESLVETAKPLLESKNFASAANLLRNYRGEFEQETQSERERIASGYEEMAAKAQPVQTAPPHPYVEQAKNIDPRKEAQEKYGSVMSAAAKALLASNPAEAASILEKAAGEDGMKEVSLELRNAAALSSGLRDAEGAILESFAKDVGKDVSLETSGRRAIYKLSSVRNGKLYLTFKEEKATITKPMALQDLSVADKAARLDGTELKEAYAGLEAAKRKQRDVAAEKLSKTGPLSHYLLAALSGTQPPVRASNAGHGGGRKPEIQSLLKGKVQSFDSGSLLIDILYDFNSPSQWDDWTALSNPKAASMTGKTLVIESDQMAGFELKPRFIDFQVKSEVAFTGNGITQGISGESDSLALIVAGLDANLDGFMRNGGQGRNLVRMRHSEAKPGERHSLELSYRNTRVGFSVDGKDWPPLPLTPSSDGISFRIGILRGARNEYDSIRIKGRLSKEWYEAELSRAASGN